jgi:hypothetical protein
MLKLLIFCWVCVIIMFVERQQRLMVKWGGRDELSGARKRTDNGFRSKANLPVCLAMWCPGVAVFKCRMAGIRILA